MSTIIPKIHQEPKEELEEEPDINENDYFKESDNLKIKIEKIKNQDNESEEKEEKEKEEKNNIIDDEIKPEKKPKRKYTMSQKRLESLEKARKYSAEKRRQNKKEKETLEAIKNDTLENQLKTELSDYKKTLLEVHNKNKDLEEQIKELKKLKINNPQPKIEKDPEPIYQSPQNPLNQKYTFEEMEYYSQERYKQLKQQDELLNKKNNTDQIQRLRDKYLLNMR